MTLLVEAETRTEAWMNAVSMLLDGEGEKTQRRYTRLNVVLEVESPGAMDPLDSVVFDELDDFYRSVGEYPVHTVAETIFPGYLYHREGIEGVYSTYPEQLDLVKNDDRIQWGTYAGRMVRKKDPENGEEFNPLKQLIQKMRNCRKSNTGTKMSCYELGVQGGLFDIALYDPTADRNRRMGGPCLSHISFDLIDDKVHLTAMYRLHDYRYKVPGNLLGLARLQACVAREVGVNIGQLVVHSSRAYIEQEGAKIREFRSLVESFAKRRDETVSPESTSS